MFLVDSNVWIESIQQRRLHDEADQFLRGIPGTLLALTQFSLFSVGISSAKKSADGYRRFIRDLDSGHVTLLALPSSDLIELPEYMQRYHLDFDDAYQYVVADRHDLQIVSVDPDFDRTPRGRVTPGQALEQYRRSQTTHP